MTLDGKIPRGHFEHERLKPSKYKNKSRKCSKSCTTKITYEYWPQNVKKHIGRI